MLRKILAGLLCAWIGFGPSQAFVRGGSASVSQPTGFTPAWQDLRMGAGGISTAIWQSPDGTMVIRTDTYGAYLYIPSGTCTYGGAPLAAPCWQQLVTATSMPAGSVNLNVNNSGNIGVTEITVCSGNTNVGYMIFDGVLYVTTNLKAGAALAWTATTQTTTQNANGGPKYAGPFLACDPNNPDILYMGVNNKLVWTNNGRSGASATFTTETDVGTTGAVTSGIAFDPNSSTATCTGGVTCSQHLWVMTSSTGVYETTNGGQLNSGGFTLRNTTGMPTTYYHIYADKFSQLWIANNTSTVYRYVNGTGWTTRTVPGSQGVVGIATDPTSSTLGSQKVISVDSSGNIGVSTDNGGTFSDPFFPETNTYTASGAQPGWLGNAAQGTGINSSGFKGVIDSSSQFWMSAGISVWTAPNPIADTAITYSANAVGIEQLVTTQIISPPGISPLASVWDRGVFTLSNPDVFPTIQYTNSNAVQQIEAAWSLDYASGTPSFITSTVNSNISADNVSASSSDGGKNWTAWPSKPTNAGNGGIVRASSTTNWVMVNSDFGGGLLYFTNNAASSWTLSTISGAGPFVDNHFNNRQPLAADRVTANSYCAVDDVQKFFSTSNGGSSWSATGATSANVDGAVYRDKLISVPGNAGHFWYTVGGGQIGSHPFNTHLWKSTNTCATFTNVNANLKEIMGFGFGAPQPGGGGYPMVYALAYLNGTLGMQQSPDAGSTWAGANIPAGQSTWPANSLDQVDWVYGDMNVYGRIYVGFLGSGATYIDTADACPWVNFSNTSPNASLTGTVTLQAQHSGLVPVTSVSFYVDGVLIGTQTTGSGTPTTYSQSWNTGGVANGAHTLQVAASGNGCTATASSTFANFSIPVTTH